MKLLLPVFLAMVLAVVFSCFGLYSYWNRADPEKTCAGCHEITASVSSMKHSSHRDLHCYDCHGTALENGIHSMREKANMVFSHVLNEKQNDEIRMNENQVLAVSERCVICHRAEYTRWKAGGHSADYADIFLDSAHNSMERLYWDCLRCHGMYYEGTIYDLVTPVSKIGPWKLKDPEKYGQPVIPCLACHQAHAENSLLSEFNGLVDSLADSYTNPVFGLYIRSDHIFLRADRLFIPEMYVNASLVKTSQGPSQALCIQCHSPGAFHRAGTSDDRTPTGVHEGLACNACHEPHSNDASRSCELCHPAISNCGLDVKTMNTTYFDPDSNNNIHFVLCRDCHGDIVPVKKSAR